MGATRVSGTKRESSNSSKRKNCKRVEKYETPGVTGSLRKFKKGRKEGQRRLGTSERGHVGPVGRPTG